MAIVSTGIGSLEVDVDETAESFMERTFTIPENVTELKFDYNVVSEEPSEWVNTVYDDHFVATITVDGEKVELAKETVNTSEWKDKVNFDFPGGDDTAYTTGWKEVVYDVSEYQGKSVKVTLKFKVWDEGDSIYDTAVLVDNIRFN